MYCSNRHKKQRGHDHGQNRHDGPNNAFAPTIAAAIAIMIMMLPRNFLRVFRRRVARATTFAMVLMTGGIIIQKRLQTITTIAVPRLAQQASNLSGTFFLEVTTTCTGFGPFENTILVIVVVVMRGHDAASIRLICRLRAVRLFDQKVVYSNDLRC